MFESLSKDIRAGRYQPGQRFPSEAALVQQFKTSRITVGRAMRELVARGLVVRRAGSGTYVRSAPSPDTGLTFGLLIPDLGNTEIFEPICRGIAAAPRAADHALLWGHASTSASAFESDALHLCDQYIQRRVAGVFFAPLEAGRAPRETNLEIVARLDAAQIPIILLDRCVLPFPDRSPHDLVGIDNRRAGFMAAAHLLRLGVRDISMIAYAGGAPTVDARVAGFREALLSFGRTLDSNSVSRLDSIEVKTVEPLLREPGQGFVCANDKTAGRLMQVLRSMNCSIPQQARIVGIDDVEYTSLLPVPLTTVHQPCREIGEAAMNTMLDRIAQPSAHVRDILLECRLIVRDSCGTK